MPKLSFNIAGPCIPGEHYILDPFRGITDELASLITGKNYFVIHAARQTGKTTLLKELVRRINSEGDYYALLYAFLQRVINGGGQVCREKPTGKKRVDLYIEYKGEKYPIELKVLQNEKSRTDSINQLINYMDGFGVNEGWLVIFDRDKNKDWNEKIFINY